MDENGATRPSFGFLDLMVLVAESWLALVLTPLAFAALAFVVVNAAPHRYESYADIDAPMQSIALATNRNFLEGVFADPAIASAYGGQLDELRAEGVASFRLDVLGSGGSTRISVEGNDADRSTALVSAIVAHLPQDVYPVAEVDLRRQDQLVAETKSLERLEQSLEQLNSTLAPQQPGNDGDGATPTRTVDYATAVGLIVQDIRTSQLTIETLSSQLAASVPRSPLVVTRNVAMPVTNAVIFAAFVGLVLVLAIQSSRSSLRHARSDPAATAKLKRIRRGFTLFGRGR